MKSSMRITLLPLAKSQRNAMKSGGWFVGRSSKFMCYPLVKIQKAIENGNRIVSFPIKNGDFP